jgi:hypothetical protein
VGLRRRTGAILDVMVAADIPDDINKIVEFRNLLSPQRLTDVVDVGANPIEGEPPYAPMLAAGLCRVTGFEPQQEALLELQTKKGPNERYLPYAPTPTRDRAPRQRYRPTGSVPADARAAHLRCRGLRLWHHGSAHRGVHGDTSRAIVSLPSHGVMVCEISSDGPPHVSQKWSGSG